MIQRFKKNIESILGYGLVILVVLTIISIIAILSGGLMSFFGFKYDSIWSIILYFIIVAIIGFPIEILTKVFPKALKSLGRIDIKTEKILFIILDMISTSMVMLVVDYFMNSISASGLAILIISFIIALFSLDKD